jgi:hypothetical protein
VHLLGLILELLLLLYRDLELALELLTLIEYSDIVHEIEGYVLVGLDEQCLVVDEYVTADALLDE